MFNRRYFNQGNAGTNHSSVTVHQLEIGRIEFRLQGSSAVYQTVELNAEQVENLVELLTGNESSKCKLWQDL